MSKNYLIAMDWLKACSYKSFMKPASFILVLSLCGVSILFSPSIVFAKSMDQETSFTAKNISSLATSGRIELIDETVTSTTKGIQIEFFVKVQLRDNENYFTLMPKRAMKRTAIDFAKVACEENGLSASKLKTKLIDYNSHITYGFGGRQFGAWNGLVRVSGHCL